MFNLLNHNFQIFAYCYNDENGKDFINDFVTKNHTYIVSRFVNKEGSFIPYVEVLDKNYNKLSAHFYIQRFVYFFHNLN